MTNIASAGSFRLGDRTVNRMGYGAMQLAGPGVFGPPKDRAAAIAVLREAVASGVNHVDTSDFYGPHVTNQIILGPTSKGSSGSEGDIQTEIETLSANRARHSLGEESRIPP
jgi:diketogulonate reductase-like aldo/keto reductase